MSERRGTKGLELWCRKMTEGYPGVEVNNMTTSWRDGLAFCAIIHHFRPDLIEFSKLDKTDVYKNNLLAFQVAENHLGIPALLEPDDMVKFPVPDRLSILTYLSQFYQAFVVDKGATSRAVPKRPSTGSTRSSVSPTPTSPVSKVPKPFVGVGLREPCAKCGQPVFIAERLNINTQLYHRTCFTCAHCNSQLSLTSYYETENEFFCETCSDKRLQPTVYFSDEESISLNNKEDTDDYYSDAFETALEGTGPTAFNRARSRFTNTLLEGLHSPDLPDGVLSTFSAGEPPDLLKFDLDLVDHIKDNDSISVRESVSSIDSNLGNLELSDSYNNQLKTANNTLESVTKEANNSIQVVPVLEPQKLFEGTSDYNSVSTTTSTVHTSEHEHENSDNLEQSVITISSSVITISDSEEEPLNIVNEVLRNDDRSIKTDTNIDTNVDSKVENINTNRNPDDYPEDLNPFGDEDPEMDKTSDMLNPFYGAEDDEDEDDVAFDTPPVPAARRKISVRGVQKLSNLYMRRVSINPYENEVRLNETKPKKFIKAPKISFDYTLWDIKSIAETAERSTLGVPSPRPRKSQLEHGSIYGSNTSLCSARSSVDHGKHKKKQAPRPPTVNISTPESGPSSLTSTPCTSAQHSPKALRRSRKSTMAPPPPISTSTPCAIKEDPIRISVSPITADDFKSIEGTDNEDADNSEIEKEKGVKDQQNINRQRLSIGVSDTQLLSTPSKWKQKKGPAPSCPNPRRKVKPLPDAIKHDFEIIEIQLQGLEKQGVRLEQLIREKCEGPDYIVDAPLSPEVDTLILDLFELVNEKNRLFRQQAGLMYLRRQHRLEEEYADLEYQIQCLFVVPELNKTDSVKAREETLMKRLYEVVEERNEIVECLEMDRLREAEEDECINNHLKMYSSKTKSVTEDQSPIKKKTKKFKLRSTKKLDIDKDTDESETKVKKEKKKKKFTIF